MELLYFRLILFVPQYYVLDVLRSSGLTRQQEVTKMFTGGLQRVARLTVDEYENQKKKNEERQAIRDQKKVRYFRFFFFSIVSFITSSIDSDCP